MTHTDYYFIGYMVMAIFTFVMIEIGEKQLNVKTPIALSIKYFVSLFWFIVLPKAIVRWLKMMREISKDKKND